jgi:hypothetical protein
MKLKELHAIAEKLMREGKGDLDVVVFASEYPEGDYGHECAEEVKLCAPRCLRPTGRLTGWSREWRKNNPYQRGNAGN